MEDKFPMNHQRATARRRLLTFVCVCLVVLCLQGLTSTNLVVLGSCFLIVLPGMPRSLWIFKTLTNRNYCTACGHRMAHRKWKETKRQPSLLPGPAVPGCCLVTFHFLWAIHIAAGPLDGFTILLSFLSDSSLALP